MKKTIFALLAAVLLSSPAIAANLDLGFSTGYTPYDRYMRPVSSVLRSLNGKQESLRMQEVRRLMRVGRSFRYSFTDPYTAALPNVTAATRKGDCKAKSLWLADQLNDPSVRYVIGKARSNSRISHAWLMWQNEGRWWILDCTNLRAPIAADRVPRNRYIPHYSYAKNGKFRHSATATMFADTAVAGKPVASNRHSR